MRHRRPVRKPLRTHTASARTLEGWPSLPGSAGATIVSTAQKAAGTLRDARVELAELKARLGGGAAGSAGADEEPDG